MTEHRSASRLRTKPWLAIAVLGLASGILAVGASLPLTMMEDTGWPWNATVEHEVGAGSSAELVHDNGTVETFTGTPQEVDTWMTRRQGELKKEYGLDQKIVAGRTLSVVGLTLFVAGLGVLLWRLVLRLRGRTSTKRAPAVHP